MKPQPRRHTLGRERTALALRLQRRPGDQARWRRLFTLMRWLILSRARKHLVMLGTAGDIDDLMQAGRMGIMKAVNDFDRKQGYAFASFANAYARQEIDAQAVAGGSVVRLPSWIRKKTPYRDARLEKVPELAQAKNAADFVKTIAAPSPGSIGPTWHSIDAPAPPEPANEGDHQEAVAALKAAIARAMLKLSPDERATIEGRYFTTPPIFYYVLARPLNCSKENVSRIERDALATLRVELAEHEPGS